MSTHVFRYLVAGELAEGDRVVLSEDDSHHLIRVIRRQVGDSLELLDAGHRMWPAELVEATVPAVVRVVGEAIAAPVAAPVRVFLGLLDWSRLDALHIQLTEIGVPEVVLFSSERSGRIPRPEEWQRRASRLNRVAESAARQSGSASISRIRPSRASISRTSKKLNGGRSICTNGSGRSPPA